MHLKFVVLVFLLTAFSGPRFVSASFWDSIPVVSQFKSLVQVASGDEDGARRTQENFLNQAPVVSQVKSLVHAIDGDKNAARKTQEQFLHEFIEPVADNTPVVGHIKGGIHMAVGDTERGERILKGASTSTAAVLGGIVAGPAGAIAAGAASDGLITGIDSAIKKEYTPFGIVDYASRIHDHSPGEHFDVWAGVGAEFAGGKVASNKGFIKEVGVVESSPPKGTFGSAKRPLAHNNILRKNDIEMPAASRRRLNTDVPDNRLNLKNPIHLGNARRRTGLPDEYSKHLEPTDFRVINDVNGNMNCYYCSLAALKGKTVTELVNEIGVMQEARGAPNIPYIVELYHDAGYKSVDKIFEGNPKKFDAFLDNNIGNGGIVRFSMPFLRKDGTGHVVHGRAWKSPEGKLHLLTSDFQQPPFSNGRFATKLPSDIETVYIISDPEMTVLGDLDRASRSRVYQTHLQRQN